jgi:hypothetical protein
VSVPVEFRVERKAGRSVDESVVGRAAGDRSESIPAPFFSLADSHSEHYFSRPEGVVQAESAGEEQPGTSGGDPNSLTEHVTSDMDGDSSDVVREEKR